MSEAQIRAVVKRQFGKELPKGRIVVNSRGQSYLFTGKMVCQNYDVIGMYIGTYEKDGFRPSIEGAQLISSEPMVELNEKESRQWMCGLNVKKDAPKVPYIIVKYNGDIIGAGKPKEGELLNYTAKNRRLPLKLL